MSSPGTGPRVSRALTARLRRETTVVVQVSAPAADPEVLQAAVREGLAGVAGLRAATGPARDLEQPRSLGPVVPVPGGVVLLLDLGELPPAVRVQAGELLAQALDRAGVQGARVGLPPAVPDSWWELGELGPAVRAHLRAPLGGPFGDGPAGQAGDLLAGLLPELRRLAGDLPLHLQVVTAVVPVAWDDAEALGRAVLAAGGSPTLVATDGSAVVAVSVVEPGGRGAAPQVAVTLAGAPGCPDVAAAARLLRALARDRAALLVWAEVSPRERVGQLSGPGWERHRLGEELAPSRGTDHWLLPDQAVPGVGWWQLLGPGHLQRVGGLPAGARPLPDGRWELELGAVEQWLPGAADRPALLRDGHEGFAPLLLDQAQASALARQRMEQARSSHPEAFRR